MEEVDGALFGVNDFGVGEPEGVFVLSGEVFYGVDLDVVGETCSLFLLLWLGSLSLAYLLLFVCGKSAGGSSSSSS